MTNQNNTHIHLIPLQEDSFACVQHVLGIPQHHVLYKHIHCIIEELKNLVQRLSMNVYMKYIARGMSQETGPPFSESPERLASIPSLIFAPKSMCLLMRVQCCFHVPDRNNLPPSQTIELQQNSSGQM